MTVEDRYGLVLRSTRAADGSRQQWLRLDEIDADLLAAFLAAEDRRFYEHHGIDPGAAARAAWTNLRAGRVVSGASTITMQLARLVSPSPRTWLGKAGQALWALRLEMHLTKHQILEQYLNRVPLGQGAIGVDAAARLYFGASARELGLGQAALLAGLARAPSGDNPLVSPARAAARRTFVLRRLVERGYASPAVAARAAQEALLAHDGVAPFAAPHFTTRILAWADDDGRPADGVWRTSLDATLQDALEAEVRQTITTLGDAGAKHAALVVLDNHTGEILAWVGSPDFWADTAGQVDMVVSPRQPGSALKPFLYAAAFDRGFTPATVLSDIAHVYQTTGGPYSPRNYDRRYHGPVRAREALASSYNVPAVEVVSRLGTGTLLATLRDAGFVSLRRGAEYYGLGLALGNGDVTLLELANGYRAFANGGVWRPYRWRAALPGEPVPPGRRVVTERSAALVVDVLADPVARIPGFGLETPLDFPFRIAAKTGTSRHFTDNWAVAVAANFTVAVWVGNFSGRPMEGVSGVTGAGPLLHRAVLATARRYDPGVLPTPADAGAVPVEICRLSGLRATERCPHAVEWFVPGTEPSRRCDWHRESDVLLPAEYLAWAEQQGAGPERAVAPRAPEPERPEDDRFRLVSPQDGDRYRIPPGVEARYATIALRAAGGAGERVRWSVDGRPVAAARWPLARGAHMVRAVRGRETAAARIAVE